MISLLEGRAVIMLTRMTSLVSIIGCTTVARQCWKLKKEGKLTDMDKLILVLCLVDLGLAIAWFVGDWPKDDHFACNFQGFWIQSLGLMDILWTDVIAFHIYSLIVLNFTFKRAEKMFKYYLIFTVGLSIFFGIAIWLKELYSYVSLWCWITDYYLKFYCFYIFVMITAVFIGIVQFRVAQVIRKDFSSLTNKSYKKDLVHINNKVTQVLIIFLITHFFGLLNRTVEASVKETVLCTAILQAILMPLRGFFNSLVYGLRGRKPPMCCIILARTVPFIGRIFFFQDDLEDDDEKVSIDLTRLQPKPKEVAIFTSTFNLGECDVESIGDLNGWIPHGYDVYVIGLQECLVLDELQAAIHKHLGGTKHYIAFRQVIGSKQTKLGFHGMIALLVFARTQEVRNGIFVPYEGANAQVKQGVNLVVTKASNKGAVGMGFRYYDTSLAFLTCHFASDSKGKTKLLKRNTDAYNTLREAVLVADNAGFDVQLQHHHTFILGDMNYRLAQPPRLILEMVAWASIQERDKIGSNWRSVKYKELFPDPRREDAKKNAVSSTPTGRSGWTTLLNFDELRQMLSTNVVFTGFEEQDIRFPPSYRRKRMQEGECDDYCDADKIANAFTTQIAAEGEAEATGVRPPSYTDRILVHSLDDRKIQLNPVRYELCDAVKGSDHRPVSAVYVLRVNEAVDGPSSIGDLIPMKLTITELSADFKAMVAPTLFDGHEDKDDDTSSVASGDDGPSRPPQKLRLKSGGPKIPKSCNIGEVIVTFPLPAEDPLIHQRKAAELARALGNDTSQLMSNITSFDYDKARASGVDVVGKTRPELGLHMLIKFNNLTGEELGQGVVSLPDPHSKILEIAASCRLTLGGILRGNFSCKIRVEQIDIADAATISSKTQGGPTMV